MKHPFHLLKLRFCLYVPLMLVAALPLVGCGGLRTSLGRLIAGSTVERVASGVLYRICKPSTGSEDLLVLWAASGIGYELALMLAEQGEACGYTCRRPAPGFTGPIMKS